MSQLRRIGLLFATDHYLPECRKQLPNYEFVKILVKKADETRTKEQAFEETLALIDSFEVILGDAIQFGPYVNHVRNVKWFQSFWAGVDGATSHPSKPPPCFTMTRCAGNYGPYVAEYVLSNIINVERRAFHFHQLKKECKWGKPPVSQDMIQYRRLYNLSILILGVGDIGLEVAYKCKVFGMKVVGLCTKIPEIKNKNIDEYILMPQLHEYLKKTDYICNILPSTVETTDLLSGEVLKQCTDNKPVFVNVGRGNVINDESLVNAVNNEWIGGAILDVFNQEPLPSDSKLWSLKNVILTPHMAGLGGFPDEVVKCFKENLKLYEENKPLKFQVDWTKMY